MDTSITLICSFFLLLTIPLLLLLILFLVLVLLFLDHEDELRPKELFLPSSTAPLPRSGPQERKKTKKKDREGGSAVEQQLLSSAPCCPGCGAQLQCVDADLPGFLPSQAFRDLHSKTCQRCHQLLHYRQAPTGGNAVLPAEHFQQAVAPQLLQRMLQRGSVLVVVVDLLELHLPAALHPLLAASSTALLVGTKVDLLPPGSPDHLRRLQAQLTATWLQQGGQQGVEVHLISAKTGYGVERLISALQRPSGKGRDIYLAGGANAGKSTLFNTLLASDLCKLATSDPLHRATISSWPGEPDLTDPATGNIITMTFHVS